MPSSVRSIGGLREGFEVTLVDSLSTTNWRPIGPAPVSAPGVGLGLAAGRIEVAVADPSNSNVVYVAGANGGVWKTFDWNSDFPTWFPLGDFEESLDLGGYHCLVVHPADPDLLFAAACTHGAGLLKSLNGGTTWQLLGNAVFEGASIGSLAVHPTDMSIIYASVWKNGPGGGVYRSTDGGQNWTNATSFHSGGVSDVIVARFDGQTLYAGLIGAAPNGIYESSDGGDNWAPTATLPSGANLGAAIRLDSASTPGILYAAYLVGSGSTAAVDRVKTTDGGQSWDSLEPTPGDPESRSWHLVLGVDPGDDQHVFVNDAYALFETQNGGDTWTRADSAGAQTIGDDWVNIGFDAGGIALATADRNVYRYAPKQKTWDSKEGNLQVTTFYGITPDPLDVNVVYGISQDHPKALAFDGTAEWAYLTTGTEVGKVLVDPTDTNRLYVSNPLDPGQFVTRSTNGGQAWDTILKANDFNASDYKLAYSVQRAFAMDPSDPARLVIGTSKVWETTDAKAASPTWNAISGILGGASASQQYITALAIAPSKPKTIYAATADGRIWVTTNGGTSWSRRDKGVFGTGAGKIVDIRIDPSNPGRVIAVGSGQGSVWYLHKVAKFLQWTNIAGDLPTYLRFGSVFVDWQFATPVLYLGTTRGVYHSVNLGAHWTLFGLDMPNTNVTDLQSSSDILYAATYGRGAWGILIGPARISGGITLGPGFVHPGDPVQGVTLALDPGDSPADRVLTAVTDRRGRFTFENVPPARYSVRRTAPPGYLPVGQAQEELSAFGIDIRSLDYTYGFDAELARETGPYADVVDLTDLPGRESDEPAGAEHEFDSPS
jgi:photosystem II stability/assembly factor-like uncharacterized protein